MDWELAGLALLSLALLISLCLNVFLCMRRRTSMCRDKEDCCYPHTYDAEVPSQDEGFYFRDLSRREEQESPRSRHEQQENPIYGNISSDVCYEMMTMRHKRDITQPLERDVNYASLDLKMAKKRKRRQRHQQQNHHQVELPHHLTPPGATTFLDVDGDVDARLPPRDTSTMVSHSSIYLNSQQMAQEAEEMERERSVNMEREAEGWEDEGMAREWDGEQESVEGKDFGNGAVCLQDNQTDYFPQHLLS
ncbi:hypothetical protein JOB18_017502 [Solea senegalensis]|uniref:Uncharacterized protein n=1 Tax=Solea senegalensis TaxID=28829 RepID=A0AAV6SH78_SOLSE|nr:uncharacterized protein LOC122779694 [Solea senegalensis]KAG7515862.1 hypothetical protein JOB18_017502 [Solea senegalensis]